jgi:hypothetical protein
MQQAMKYVHFNIGSYQIAVLCFSSRMAPMQIAKGLRQESRRARREIL